MKTVTSHGRIPQKKPPQDDGESKTCEGDTTIQAERVSTNDTDGTIVYADMEASALLTVDAGESLAGPVATVEQILRTPDPKKRRVVDEMDDGLYESEKKDSYSI